MAPFKTNHSKDKSKTKKSTREGEGYSWCIKHRGLALLRLVENRVSSPEGAVGAAGGRRDMTTQSMILNMEARSGDTALQSQLSERLRQEDHKEFKACRLCVILSQK